MIYFGKLAMWAVLGVHAGLALWAVGGMIGWLGGGAPWQQLNNPEIPHAILLLQWLSSLFTATALLAGFALRLPVTPLLCVLGYAVMAAICALETTAFMTNSGRYVAMITEYATYLLFGFLLYRLPEFQQRFAPAFPS